MYNAMSKTRSTGGLIRAIQKDEPDLLESLILEKSSYGLDDLALALHAAADIGSHECTAVLLRHKALPNIHDNRGLTPLLIAAKNGHARVLEQLLNVGCNVNKPSFRVRATALHWAATNGHYHCVEKLLKYGAKPEPLTAQSRTPLMLAARSDEPEVVQLLVEAGAAVNKCDYSRVTALHMAAEEGSINCLRVLLRAGAKVNCQTRNGDTPLTFAAQHGHTKTLRELLKRPDVDLNLCCRQLTALHWAAETGEQQCIELLLGAGMDPNKASKESYCSGDFVVNRGVTPLMLACKGGYSECAKLLLKAGTLVDSYDNDNLTALLYATKYDRGPCIEVLMDYGADVDGELLDNECSPADEDEGFQMCPLIMAAERDCKNAVTSLLRGNARVDMVGYGSWHQRQGPVTAFEVALMQSHFLVCQMLVAAGYSVRTINRGILEEASVLLAHSNEAISRWLSELLQTPWQLSQLCRKCIRKCMGRRLVAGLSELPLPPALISYVDLAELESIGQTDT